MKQIIFIIILSIMLFVSCTKTPVSDLPYDHVYYELSENVYYIAGDNLTFARYYQMLIDDNPGIKERILCVFGDGEGESGEDCGYFVILK